jgi:hypothetical protein
MFELHFFGLIDVRILLETCSSLSTKLFQGISICSSAAIICQLQPVSVSSWLFVLFSCLMSSLHFFIMFSLFLSRLLGVSFSIAFEAFGVSGDHSVCCRFVHYSSIAGMICMYCPIIPEDGQ